MEAMVNALVALREHRAVHAIDIENLCGSGRISCEQVRAAQIAYRDRVDIGPNDLVVIACAHVNVEAVEYGWFGSKRILMRSGPDGADLALIEVMECERIPERFSRLYLGSGDGGFAPSMASLASRDVYVVAVARMRSQSRLLRMAASESRYIGTRSVVALPRMA